MLDPAEDRPPDNAVTVIARNYRNQYPPTTAKKNIPETYEIGSFYLK